MRLHFPLPRHTLTPYIRLVPDRCAACWQCVAVCPRGVLGKAIVFKHRHAHVDHAAACQGCRRCVRTCPHAAIVAAQRQPQPLNR